jgi:mannitol/fructose-specific phosphotransferase system IIA component (Ntr-type)
MLLGDILHEGVIKTDLEARDKYEAIEELVDLLVKAEHVPASLRSHIVEVVEERERSLSTGMDHGIALPHGTTDRLDDIVAALGISQHGVPFETLDGQPARLVILLVLPRRNFQGHVRTLAGVAHLLNNHAFREELMSAATVGEVIDLIATREGQES